ncbi:thioester reductase domain-containing protein [Amycolatopsis sp. Hca4]|uniref:thioester reductase domain-containing protein n=1 Tax=Amycolatopsis sp. Hca4 TaxID=2742131 RepID=UPI001590E208|nr:thioester reductase domain-containing protein [Amycolatopsis sp. Hca4]QKV80602.1 thioester reductase domain-containing protein [Amycolatopsis sp. Hca4]
MSNSSPSEGPGGGAAVPAQSAGNSTDIAVIGVGCRFPDAWTPAQYWRNIERGVVSMRELSDEQLRAAGHSEEALDAPGFVRVGASLPGVADFAAEFFGYKAREVDAIDPQQRIFLEACWEALESAGHPPRPDGPVTGVFASSAAGNYSAAVFAARVRDEGLAAAVGDLDLTLGGQADFMTSRAAYKLGLRGPSVSVQTGCSSSLTAVHYGTLSLLSGESDLVLAGGATVLDPLLGYQPAPGGWVSEDGYVRSFDAKSSGTTYGSGVGVVVLRRLADALADGDPVLAVLRGTAVGNDGGDRLGYVAPNLDGVADVVAAALRVSGVPAGLVRYVEAHGTGTPLGDHVELLALAKAFRLSTTETGYCGLGSVMANIGHLGPAAGIAGFIKAVHVARTGVLPPHPAFDSPRDPAELAASPFHVPTERVVDPAADRHVLVNSMGVGGTNAVAVLGAPPAPSRPPAEAGDTVRLVLSARTRAELDALSRQLADELDAPDAPVGDIAHTLRVGRAAFGERRVVTAPPGRLAAALRLPRPPLAATARPVPRRAVVVGTQPPAGLLAALPPDTTVSTVDPGEADGIHRIFADGPGELDELLATAWLNGVDVDWAAAAGGTGRRVPLPTYPFQRKRFWPLDRLDVFAPARPAAEQPAATGSLEDDIAALWGELFDRETVGVDEEFGALGGTSLLSVQMALRLQQRHGVLVNVHRAGGSRATVRRLAGIVRAQLADGTTEQSEVDDHGPLVDADLKLPLVPMSRRRAPGRDVLLTGATGYLGAFLLHELLKTTQGRVYCLVRAADPAEAAARLREAAAAVALPAPDPDRAVAVPADLRTFGGTADSLAGGVLADRIGHVVHCAARVVFTEPYRVLREDNVLPLVDLLNWVRRHGIRDFSLVSTLAATAPASGTDGTRLETRRQPLHPDLGGYGISKWVGERLLERAEEDGIRARVFRPGLIMAAGGTGACNARDLVWLMLASGLATGTHPLDDRAEPVAPVDVIARAIAELALSPASAGRVYHLADERSIGTRDLFGLLAGTGLETDPMPLPDWRAMVAKEALARDSRVLSAVALYELEGHELAEDAVQVRAWQPWLRRRGLSSAIDGAQLRRGLEFLAAHDEAFGELLPELAKEGK